MARVVLLYATAPDEATAETIAAALVSEGRAACVNILGEITSHFRWKGAAERTREVAFLVKTASPEKARERIVALHPYETPAIVALAVEAELSSAPFLAWVAAESAGR